MNTHATGGLHPEVQVMRGGRPLDGDIHVSLPPRRLDSAEAAASHQRLLRPLRPPQLRSPGPGTRGAAAAHRSPTLLSPQLFLLFPNTSMLVFPLRYSGRWNTPRPTAPPPPRAKGLYHSLGPSHLRRPEVMTSALPSHVQPRGSWRLGDAARRSEVGLRHP